MDQHFRAMSPNHPVNADAALDAAQRRLPERWAAK